MDHREHTGRDGIRWERAAAIAICAGAAALAVRLFFRYLVGALLPFLLAYLLSCLLRPLVDRMTARSRRGQRPLSALLVLLVTGGAAFVTVAGVRRALTELEELLPRLGETMEQENGGFSTALDYIWSLSEHLPFLRRFEQTPGFSRFCLWLDEAVRNMVGRLFEQLSGFLSAGAVALVSGLPTLLLFLTVFLMSCYYFTAEPGVLAEQLTSRLPPPWQTRLTRFRRGAGRSLRRYFRACLLMALVTFSEMLVGLSVLRMPYPFLLALLIAAVDFLPVLGTGTVLIPWGVVELLLGHTFSGLGLLLLYAVSAVLRELIEPHLVGRSLGLHPLLSLLSVYAGFRLFGVPGMIITPFFAAAVGGARDAEERGDTKDAPGDS